MEITELVAELALQVGIILLAVRVFGHLARKAGIPPVLGELLAGVIIGPYALGGIALPGFPMGVFPLMMSADHTLAVSLELYAFATVASIVLLFVSGLETDLRLFLRYSLAGGVIGISGSLLAFAAGTLCGAFLLGSSFLDPRCLFFGIIAMTSSIGISARILSERRKMGLPESVTIISAGVFEDVLWIVFLAVVLGIYSVLGGHGDSLSAQAILLMAGRIFGIWLGATALFLLGSKAFASFLRIFKHSHEFTVLALGFAFILAGILEKQGLALIIGAYIAGLSLSKTDVAAIIQERVHMIYIFFVPMFFAIMGMMVNVREIISPPVLVFGLLYTFAICFAKLFGNGVMSMLLGFNRLGAFRVGVGLIPRGEGALISCGIGLAIGIIDNLVFSAAVFMVFLTIIACLPMFGLALKTDRRGTKKQENDEDSISELWEFETSEVAELVTNNLLNELRNGGFYIQSMSKDEGFSQARKGDIALFITEKHKSVTITTSKTDMPFVKNEIYEVVLELSNNIEKLKTSSDPAKMKRDLSNPEARTTKDIRALIDSKCFTLDLKSETKLGIIVELVDLLHAAGKLLNREQVLTDVLNREKSMSTGMENGIALPHAKTDGVVDTAVAVGIKKQGIDFESTDDLPAKFIVLIVTPKKGCGLYVQFLSAVGAILKEDTIREAVINAETPHEAVEILKKPDHYLHQHKQQESKTPLSS